MPNSSDWQDNPINLLTGKKCYPIFYKSWYKAVINVIEFCFSGGICNLLTSWQFPWSRLHTGLSIWRAWLILSLQQMTKEQKIPENTFQWMSIWVLFSRRGKIYWRAKSLRNTRVSQRPHSSVLLAKCDFYSDIVSLVRRGKETLRSREPQKLPRTFSAGLLDGHKILWSGQQSQPTLT